MTSLELPDVTQYVPLTFDTERLCLSRLSAEVKPNGVILEIGCLYGGTTAIIAFSNNQAEVIAIDNFSWHPEGHPATSAELFMKNMSDMNLNNVKVIEGDSRKIGRHWKNHIDLLWIDGGHSFPYVYSDLRFFGPHADVIAVHDYDNPAWPSIRKAIHLFIRNNPGWMISEVVESVCVLRRTT